MTGTHITFTVELNRKRVGPLGNALLVCLDHGYSRHDEISTLLHPFGTEQLAEALAVLIEGHVVEVDPDGQEIGYTAAFTQVVEVAQFGWPVEAEGEAPKQVSSRDLLMALGAPQGMARVIRLRPVIISRLDEDEQQRSTDAEG